jgi:hypothetical protein
MDNFYRDGDGKSVILEHSIAVRSLGPLVKARAFRMTPL